LEIRVLHRPGKGFARSHVRRGVRKTGRRYLHDESAGITSHARPATKLDPFKGYVIDRLTAAAPMQIPANVLLQKLGEWSYTGAHTLEGVGGEAEAERIGAPIVRFETGPGEPMQIDWAVIRRDSNRLSVFVASLGASRATYVEFVSDQRVETLLKAHENAFLPFVGTPREVLYHNAHGGVARHGYVAGRHPFHPDFLNFVGIVVSIRGGARRIGHRPKGKVQRFIR